MAKFIRWSRFHDVACYASLALLELGFDGCLLLIDWQCDGVSDEFALGEFALD